MESVNPFRYGAPVEGDSFCDRRDELAALVERMRSGIHAFVLSPRRYGKTSLLLEALRRARRGGGRCGYANLLFCTTEDEVASVVLTAVAREVLRPTGRAKRSVEDVVRHLRVTPSVSFGADGAVSFSFDPSARRSSWLEVLVDAVGLLADAATERHPAALVLDEFQQVAEIGPRGLGGTFKALADESRHASLVFAGSHLSVMERLTRERGAPLYGMGETFYLDVVGEADMVAHLVARSAAGGKRLDDAVARLVYEAAGTVPNDVQWLAHAAFEAAGTARTITAAHVEAGLAAIVARQAGVFAERYETLSPTQRRIVRALAAGPVEKIYAREFLDTVRVANANAVTTALKKLTDREMVRRGTARWELASPFLRAWLLGDMPDSGR